MCCFEVIFKARPCCIYVKNRINRGVAQLVARLLWEQDAGGSSPFTPTKNPSTLSADFLFKPIGLVYHHAIACISLPHLCGVYHHTAGVHISIGLMRYSGFATDDMQNFVLMIYKASP